MRPILALALSLVATAAAAQSLPAPTPTASPFEGDARLNKPITVRWKKASLFDALQEVSSATGVRLAPDRAIVDEPVMAAEKDVPARKVLEQIAKLEHFTWVHSGGTAQAPGYLLYQSRSAKLEEENEINAARKAVTEELQRQLARYRQLGKLPQDQLQREADKADEQLDSAFSGGFSGLMTNGNAVLKLQDAMLVRSVATPTGHAMLSVLDGLTPQQWGLIQDEQLVVLSTRPEEGEFQLPEGVGDQLRSATPSILLPRSLVRALGSEVETALSQIDGKMKESWGKAEGFKISIQLNLSLGAQPAGMFRVSPEPMGAGESQPLFLLSGMALTSQPSMFTAPDEDPAEREKRLAADPLLGKKAVIKLPVAAEPPAALTAILGKTQRLQDLLPLVEEAYGVHLASDSYSRQFLTPGTQLADGEYPLYQVLDRMAGLTRKWELDGDTVRFRSKSWAHDRRAEIPVRYMRRWLEQRARNNGLGLDDLAEIASILRDEQVESLMPSALEQNVADISDFMMVSTNREILRLWGKLLPLQRRTLLAGKAIPVAALYPPQQAQLLALGRSKNPSMFAMFQSRPQRSPQRLANASLTVETAANPQAAQPAPPTPVEAPEGTPAPAPRAPATRTPSRGAAVTPAPGGNSIYRINLNFPDGKKDTYTVMLTHPTQTAARAEDAAPAVRK